MIMRVDDKHGSCSFFYFLGRIDKSVSVTESIKDGFVT